jgi:hypothetical protein
LELSEAIGELPESFEAFSLQREAELIDHKLSQAVLTRQGIVQIHPIANPCI